MTLAAQPSAVFLDDVADAIEAALDDPVCGLFTSPDALQPTTVYADLVQPTYTGYSRVAMTVGTRRYNANGDQIIPLGMASFQPTANPAEPITVVGSFIGNTTATPVLELSELLDEPWVVTDTGSALDVVWEIYVKADPNWGGICTSCVN